MLWIPYDHGSSQCVGSQPLPQSTSPLVHSYTLLHAFSGWICSVYYLYALVRRPRLILDFTLTLVFNHLVLTTYYAAAIPTSVFFWLVMCVSAAGTVVFAEQLCVKREMSEGLVVGPTYDGDDNVEMGSLLRED